MLLLNDDIMLVPTICAEPWVPTVYAEMILSAITMEASEAKGVTINSSRE